MRLSTDPKDPGYRAYREGVDAGYSWIIELDGKRVEMIETADDGDGVVVGPVLREDGSLTVAEDGVSLAREERRGRVVIRRRFPSWRRLPTA